MSWKHIFGRSLKNGAISLKRRMNAQARGGGNDGSESDPELLKLPKKNVIGPIEAEFKAKLDPYTNAGVEDDPSGSDDDTTEVSPINSFEKTDLAKVIFDCATRLSLKERELLARVYKNQTHREIGEALSIGETSVGSRVGRLFKKMGPIVRARMGQQGLKDYGINTNHP